MEDFCGTAKVPKNKRLRNHQSQSTMYENDYITSFVNYNVIRHANEAVTNSSLLFVLATNDAHDYPSH